MTWAEYWLDQEKKGFVLKRSYANLGNQPKIEFVVVGPVGKVGRFVIQKTTEEDRRLPFSKSKLELIETAEDLNSALETAYVEAIKCFEQLSVDNSSFQLRDNTQYRSKRRDLGVDVRDYKPEEMCV